MNLMENMGLTPKENKREIKLIRYDRLIASPDNFYDTNDIDNLKRAILIAGGVRQNLIVQPEEAGMYTVISGHRRLKAVRELILDDKEDIPDNLPCEIEEDPDMADLLLITTNSTARELKAWEKVEQFERTERLYEKWKSEGKVSGKKREILAKMLGESKTGIARIQAIKNNLQQYFMQEFQCGHLGMSIAYEISKMQADAQEKLYKKWKEKESTLSLMDVYQEAYEEKQEKKEDELPCDADVPEQRTIEDNGGETIKKQTGDVEEAEHLPKERREYIPLKKGTGCEILLRTLKIAGEYDTVIQYISPLNCGKENIGRYPNIASARMAAIGKAKGIDKCLREALVDAGLIDDDEWEDAPEETEEIPVTDTEERKKKMTGEYYEQCLAKMEENGYAQLEACERCTVASACEKCCKTCTDPCNAQQECYKDIEEKNRKREFAKNIVKTELLNKKNYHLKLFEINKDEERTAAAENEKCAADLYDALIRQIDIGI
jgi:ParB family chromosome partitioning protein